MKVTIGKKTHQIQPHTAEPVIEVDAQEQGERSSLRLTHIDVVDAKGLIARFWVDLCVRNGRPEVVVRTKVGKNRQMTREKRVQGTFNTL